MRRLLLCLFLACLPAHAQWIVRPAASNLAVHAAVDADLPAGTTTLIAAQYANNEVSLIRSDDEGLTWRNLAIDGDAHPFVYWVGTIPNADGSTSRRGDLFASVLVSNQILDGYHCKLARSSDRGLTWTILAANTYACSITIDPANPSIMYGVSDGYVTLFYPWVFRSEDGGRTWHSASTGLQQLVRGIRVAADGAVYAVGSALSVSRDHGATWTPLPNLSRYGALPNQVVRLNDLLPVRHPLHGDSFLVAATDDGLYTTSDAGLTWRPSGMQDFNVGGLRRASAAPGGIDVSFTYEGGSGLLRGDVVLPLMNGLQPGVGAGALVDGRYAGSAAGLLVCPDLQSCIGGALPRTVEMVEFHNTLLDHYFITFDAAEAAGIDRGAAGPGWTRTGLSFPAYRNKDGLSYLAQSGCRFYGTPGVGPNSHFFTADAGECAQVLSDPGWMREDATAFVAMLPQLVFDPVTKANVRDCGIRQNVLRLYNNRYAQNDSNHRYTTERAVYDSMIAAGWIGEGPRFCVPRRAPAE
jgi:photosystem II stability/assembly factor-like uncharacterized protein